MRTAIERWMQNSNDYLFRIALPSGELLGCNEAADWLKEQFKTKGKQTLTDENLQIVFNELAAALQGASDAEINKENRISFHALRLSNSNEALVTLNVSEVVYPGKKALEAFENNVAGIYESRLDGKIIAANDAFGEILGFPTEELLTLNGNALYVHPDERVQFINAITTQGKVKNYEIRYQRKDETIAWCVESAFLYEKEDEKRIIGTVVDITEQKRNKDRFRNLFVSSADAVFLLEQGLVQDVNDRAADLFGGDLSRFKGLDALSQQNGLFVLSANDQVLVHKKMVSLKSGDIDRKRLIGRRA
ncbi:MAG: hypothetical protein RL226_2159, partial [Bacteroidota bacterium]